MASWPLGRVRPRRASLLAVVVLTYFGLHLVSSFLVSATIRSELGQTIEQQAEALIGERLEAAVLRVLNRLSRAEQSVNFLVDLIDASPFQKSGAKVWERELFRTLSSSSYALGIRMVLSDGTDIFAYRGSKPEDFTTYIKDSTADDFAVVHRTAAFVPLKRVLHEGDWLDPRTFSWFAAAWKREDSIWIISEDASEAKFHAPVVARAFRLSPELQGVVALYFDVAALRQPLLESVKESDRAVVVLDHQGRVVAYRDQSLFMMDTDFSLITAYGNTIPELAFASIRGAQSNAMSRPQRLGSQISEPQHLALIRPIGYTDLPWRIGMTGSEASFTGGVQANMEWVVYVLLVALLGTFVFAVPITQLIIEPLESFSQQMEGLQASRARPPAVPPPPYRELSAARNIIDSEMSQRRMFQAAYERTFDFSSRGLARVDPASYRFLYCNARLCSMLGIAADVLTEKTLWDVVAPPFHRSLRDFGALIVSDSEFSIDCEPRLTDGQSSWMRLTALLIRDHLGKPDHALLLVDDITEMKIAEGKLEHLRRELYHIGRVNMLGELAEGLAHELNQPLTAIMHDLDSAKRAFAGGQAGRKQVLTILEDIDEHTLRAGEIIRALRQLIRKDTFAKSVFDLAQLIEQTGRLVAGEARQSGVELIVESGPSCDLLGNRSQIAQIVVNLARNAIEALKQCEGRTKQIRIKHFRRHDKIYVQVEDNGPGIPQGVDVFRKFETTRPGGMGLGLSICQSLAAENDGTISYLNLEPHGTCFVLVFAEQGTLKAGGPDV